MGACRWPFEGCEEAPSGICVTLDKQGLVVQGVVEPAVAEDDRAEFDLVRADGCVGIG